MNEFSSPIAPDQIAFLTANKAELIRTDSGKAIWQNRVKMASEAYQILKGISADVSVASIECEPLVPTEDEAEAQEVVDADEFPSWPTFRDNFLLDWIGSRIVVTDKEADMIFERTAEEALAAIEQAEQNDSETTIIDSTPSSVLTDTSKPLIVTIGDVPAVKRRGRPPGKKVPGSTSYLPITTKTLAKLKAKTARKKYAAKAKKSVARGSASAKAQTIIEKYGARDWSRKDIIAKLQTQLEMGAAYASTLYQKYA